MHTRFPQILILLLTFFSVMYSPVSQAGRIKGEWQVVENQRRALGRHEAYSPAKRLRDGDFQAFTLGQVRIKTLREAEMLRKAMICSSTFLIYLMTYTQFTEANVKFDEKAMAKAKEKTECEVRKTYWKPVNQEGGKKKCPVGYKLVDNSHCTYCRPDVKAGSTCPAGMSARSMQELRCIPPSKPKPPECQYGCLCWPDEEGPPRLDKRKANNLGECWKHCYDFRDAGGGLRSTRVWGVSCLKENGMTGYVPRTQQDYLPPHPAYNVRLVP